MVLHTNESEIDYADGMRALQKGGSLVLGQKPRSRRTLIVWCLIIGLVVWLLLAANSGPGQPAAPVVPDSFWGLVIAYLAVFFGSVIVAAVVGRWALPRMLRKPGRRSVTIAPDSEGILADSEETRAHYRWSLFTRHAESDKSFALLGKRINVGAWLLFVVPKSAFADPAQMDEFRGMLRSHVLPEATLQRQGSGAFPVSADDPPEPVPDARREMAGQIILDNVFYEHRDFAVATAGWRREKLLSRWNLIVLGIMAIGVLASSGIAVYAIIRFGAVAAVMPMLPLLFAVLIAKPVVLILGNLTGAKSVWKQHVLSQGPASVTVDSDGVVLRSAQHEMLMKPATIQTIVESPAAFSVVGRQWEIVIPKRLLSAEGVQEARNGLQALGEIQNVQRGKVLRVGRATA